MRTSTFVGLGALVLALGACGTASPTSTPTRSPRTAIVGTLSMVGGPGPGIREFVTGTIRITNTATHAVTTVATNEYGQFVADVPQGSYSVVGHSPSYGGGAANYECQALFEDPYTRKAVQTVTVGSGGFHGTIVAADVYCQMD